jgi:serine protease Do
MNAVLSFQGPASRLVPAPGRFCRTVWLTALGLACLAAVLDAAEPSSFHQVIQPVQPNMVKIYGAGGIRGLEAYQSGILISAEGHILTVWSYVLDSEVITVTLNDGHKFEARLVGADPRFEIALLKIEGQDLPHFSLSQAVELAAGDRVLAFSNLFNVAVGDEPTSVQHGTVSVKTQLAARKGVFETPYNGQVYVLDAMTNNPGAAGGALTNIRGELAGILGKELRNALNNTWLNYAIPINVITASVDDILAGKTLPRTQDEEAKKPPQAWTLSLLGLRLVPDVLPKTPPFIDHVAENSPAAKAGLKPDDLILFVNNRVAASCKGLAEELSFIDRIDPVRLTVQRGQDLLDVVLEAVP